jgi:hypothetical protein
VSWLHEQRTVRDFLLAERPAESHLRRLGGDPARWLAYRRMVRARFSHLLEQGLEYFRVAIGAERFAALVDQFLAEGPPTSPYLRDVPAEFLRFLEKIGEPATWPTPFALELARFECIELELAHVQEQAPARGLVPLEMHRVAVLSSALRLLDLEYPVHRFDPGQPELMPSPLAIAVYRDPSSHDVTTLELNPLAARILRGIERHEGALVDVVKNAAGEASAVIDAAFVDALSALLADLVERGVLLGSSSEMPNG